MSLLTGGAPLALDRHGPTELLRSLSLSLFLLYLRAAHFLLGSTAVTTVPHEFDYDPYLHTHRRRMEPYAVSSSAIAPGRFLAWSVGGSFPFR